LLRRHLADHAITPGGLLFRGVRGGLLSESVYGRTWHAARAIALGPSLSATPLARRPYDLRQGSANWRAHRSSATASASVRSRHQVHKPERRVLRHTPPRRAIR
jgi:hypothetical protein